MATADVMVGYIDIDESAPSDQQYRYWCPVHVPEVFREPWREIDAEEAIEGDLTCMVCRKPLAPAPTEGEKTHGR